MSGRGAPAGLGAATVLTILLTLCLTVFAALALTSAQADARLSEAAAARTAEYYAADAEGARLYAAFAAGTDAVYETDIPIGDNRALSLCLSRGEDGTVHIERWRVTIPEGPPETSLPVWTGENGGPFDHAAD